MSAQGNEANEGKETKASGTKRKQVERNDATNTNTNTKRTNQRAQMQRKGKGNENEHTPSTHPNTQTPKRRRRRRCRLAATNNGRTNEQRTTNKEYARTSSLFTLHPLVSPPTRLPVLVSSSFAYSPSPSFAYSLFFAYSSSSFVLRLASCVLRLRLRLWWRELEA